MPTFNVKAPDGSIIKVNAPEGATEEQAIEFAASTWKPSEAVKPQPTTVQNIAGGIIKGASRIGETALAPFDILANKLGIENSIIGRRDRGEAINQFLQQYADPESLAYKTGDIGTQVAGTAGAGGVLAKGLTSISQAPRAVQLAEALSTGGMRAGGAGMGTRMAGGALAGGAQAGIIEPDNAGAGALIGAVMPAAMIGAGKAGKAIGEVISGKPVAPSTRQIAQESRKLGYVIPPTQVKPSLANRALEGFSGKITTAQNASARNQEVTNELARKAIGATELSPAGIAQVRQQANQAYDDLAQVVVFKADQNFANALDSAGSSSAAMRKNFPELVNTEIDDLISSLKSRDQFDAQSTIEAIKRFRADAFANKSSSDPAKIALGKTQNKISNALEDMIERNLSVTGNTGLLQNYRNARQTLSKVYDVENAMNPATGNIDAKKLAALAKKRPLSGELKQIANFAEAFPKASQTIEKMGSLPQVSPLDFATFGTASALTTNPALLAGVLARPAARSAVLSELLQNRMVSQPTQGRLSQLLMPELEQLAYRTAPVIGSQ